MEPERASLPSPDVDRGGGAPDEQSPPIWRRVLKVFVFVLFLVVGSFAAGGRPRNGVYYSSWDEVVQSLVVGALVALLCLGVVGAIGRLLARKRGITRSWLHSATTFPALLVTLVVLVLSAGGRAAQHEEALSKAAPNPNGSLVQRQKANLDAQDWARTRKPVEIAVNATLHRHPVFLNLFTRNGNTVAVRNMASSIRTGYVREAARWRALPQTPLVGLQRADSEAIRGVALAASAYADYVAGLKANAASGLPFPSDRPARALLDRGDAKLQRAARVLRAFQSDLVALDSEYSIR